MKKNLIIILGFLFLVVGCESEFQVRLDAIKARGSNLNDRQSALIVESNTIKRWQADLIKTLNDDQLEIYESASQAYKSNDMVAKEIADRKMQQSFNPNSYGIATRILIGQAEIRRENENIQFEHSMIMNEYDNLEEWNRQRNQNIRDYMLIDAIRNNP